MEAVNLSDVKFTVVSAVNRAIVNAKNNLASAWVEGVINEQQLDTAIHQLDDALSLAKLSISNAESNQEIDNVTVELKKHLQDLVTLTNLPCKF
jgi:hypothetical protein